jgi:hypothetical protein
MYLFVRNVSYLCMVDWHVMTLVSSYDIFSYILCSCSISSYLYILASQDATKAGGSFFFCFVFSPLILVVLEHSLELLDQSTDLNRDFTQ